MIAPVFIKGHLMFSLESFNLEFTLVNISSYGCMGLKWGPLKPKEHFGKLVQATITVPNADPLMIRSEAVTIREFTHQADYLGVRFNMKAEDRAKLSQYIAQYGFYPTDYIRKHPRIPSNHLIQTFPLQALVTPESWKKNLTDKNTPPMIFDVLNLSPNGVLVSSENLTAKEIGVNDYLEVILEPRGWFPTPVRVRGVVCRIIEDIHPENGNFTRSFGIKFVRVDEINRTAFLDLLKDILERFKQL